MSEYSPFVQTGPNLPNPWASDRALQRAVRARVSERDWIAFSVELDAFGAKVLPSIEPLGQQAERERPEHVPFDTWGNRVDMIRVSRAWNELDAIAAREGLVALGYERAHQASSRILQFAKLALFHPASAFYTCPLAMTDGAARVIELHGSQELKDTVFKSLTSRVPGEFWTSGQWMTERAGGSDVSNTSVTAKFVNGQWRLFGDKWFTSATTSQMAIVLAKVEEDSGQDKGLALFCVELRDANGRLRGIRVNRLKDKLGTKALPTAELSLEGAHGVMIGKPGEGIKKVAGLLNVTRLYNSVCSLGSMARGLQLATAYSYERRAFGRLIAEQPLHLETLADLRARYAAVVELVFHTVGLLGREECGMASPDESASLRLLTPLTKLYTAREAISNASETIEAFGGTGYIEDSGVPRLLRDAQVFPIWEGTTNVLSLDALRAMSREAALQPLLADLGGRIKRGPSSLVRARLERRLAALAHYAKKKADHSPDEQSRGARDFAWGLAETAAATFLFERASTDPDAQLAIERFAGIIGEWIARDEDVGAMNLESVKSLAFGGASGVAPGGSPR